MADTNIILDELETEVTLYRYSLMREDPSISKEQLRNKVNKKADKEMVKEIKEQNIVKKTKLKEQKKIKEKINNEDNVKQEEERLKNAEWKLFKSRFNEMKYETLDKIDDKTTFKNVKRYFNLIDLKKYDNIEDVKNKIQGDLTKFNKHVEIMKKE